MRPSRSVLCYVCAVTPKHIPDSTHCGFNQCEIGRTSLLGFCLCARSGFTRSRWLVRMQRLWMGNAGIHQASCSRITTNVQNAWWLNRPDMFLQMSILTCSYVHVHVLLRTCVCVCVWECECVCVCVVSAWTDWVLLSLSLRRPPSHQKSSAQQPRVIRYQADRCQNCRAMPATLISIRLNR